MHDLDSQLLIYVSMIGKTVYSMCSGLTNTVNDLVTHRQQRSTNNMSTISRDDLIIVISVSKGL